MKKLISCCLALTFFATSTYGSATVLTGFTDNEIKKANDDRGKKRNIHTVKPPLYSDDEYFRALHQINLNLFARLRLDEETISKIKAAYPLDNLSEGITLNQAFFNLAASNASEQEKNAIVVNFLYLLSDDIYDFFDAIDSWVCVPDTWKDKLIPDLFNQAQDLVNEAKDTAAAKADKHKKSAIIQDFLNEPLGKSGMNEYRLRYFKNAEENLKPGTTTVDNLLFQIVLNSMNPNYQDVPSANPSQATPSKVILRNMSIDLLPSKHKTKKYFGGEKPKITEDVINNRLTQLQQQYFA